MKQFCTMIAIINVLLHCYLLYNSSRTKLEYDIEEIKGYKNMFSNSFITNLSKQLTMFLTCVQVFYLAFNMILFYKYTIIKYITFVILLYMAIHGFYDFLYPDKVLKNKVTNIYIVYNFITNTILLFYNVFIFFLIPTIK